MFSDAELLAFMETQQPGLRATLSQVMQSAGVQPCIPACGLCSAPVENGCEHVVPFAPAKVSLRQMVTRRCRNCNHQWVQPSKRGACTECGSRDVVNLDERVCGATRA